MTYREYAEKHHPGKVSSSAIGGVYGCPKEMKDVKGAPIAHGEGCQRNWGPYEDCGPACTRCWDQEMPGTKPTKKPTACWDQEMPGTKKPAPRKGLSGKIVYIAGPITGVEEYWKAFEAAEEELTGQGYIVLTPSRLPKGLTNAQAMRTCLAMIDTADWVYFLPGSQESRGARLELDYCLYIGKPYQWHEGGGQG